MTTQFQFRLIGVETPQGQIDVDDAVAILQKLQELATKVGRVETGAEQRGRPAKKVERIAKLRLVGLNAGSTVIEVQRVEDEEILTFDLEHEQGFDARFAEIIEAIGADTRPAAVSDTIAETAADLVTALPRRGSVDGWDFKTYVLGMLFYRFISENLDSFLTKAEREAGRADFRYATLSDADAEFARKDTVEEKGFFILPSHLFANVRAHGKRANGNCYPRRIPPLRVRGFIRAAPSGFPAYRPRTGSLLNSHLGVGRDLIGRSRREIRQHQ